MDYLVYAYLQGGQDRAALRVKQSIEAIRITEKHTLGMDYAIAAAPAVLQPRGGAGPMRRPSPR